MRDLKYMKIQTNLQKREGPREAFTDSMLGMTGTINCLVCDNVKGCSSLDDQLTFMQDKCAEDAKLFGLHEIAKVKRPKEDIVGNKRVMVQALAADKRMQLAGEQLVMEKKKKKKKKFNEKNV